jgi:hypothetical protein
MRIIPLLMVVAISAASVSAQKLTAEQRAADLRQLAGLYAKNYGPYEWKRDAKGFDLYDLKPWLDRAAKLTDDIEFADLLVEYVASLDDAHDSISFPSTWTASLGFSTDIYDGKVLIDSINRTRLPLATYPFVIGDELVSLDAKPVSEWLTRLRKYNIAANEGSTRRLVAGLLTSRSQSFMPIAPRITPEKSTVEIRRASTGELETFELTWLKSGTEMEFGPLPMPGGASASKKKAAAEVTFTDDPTMPAHMLPLRSKMDLSFPTDRQTVLNFGGRSPIFTPPANFQRRLGGAATDIFFSGTFESGGRRIGFIRIPSFSPANTNLALNQFIGEMIFFEQNTDGLIIDDMRNPGGSVAYCEFLLTLIMPNTFRTLGFEIRATSGWVASFQQSVTIAEANNFPEWQVLSLKANLADVKAANQQVRGKTGPISLNQSGTLDLLPGPFVYTKPLIVLVDEMSASGGDFFPAVVQDNKRGLIVGMRTMGAGGNVVGYDATTYTEGFTRVTESLMNRKNPVLGTEFPASNYVENVGVRPDIVVDYMTRENLMNGGRPFVEKISQIMVDHIAASRN